jgi:hypothetical protein
MIVFLNIATAAIRTERCIFIYITFELLAKTSLKPLGSLGVLEGLRQMLK